MAVVALVGLAIWTALALLAAAQAALYLEQIGRPVEWAALVGRALVDWYSCAVFTPALFWLARHAPLDRRRWPRTLPLTLAATSMFVLLKYAILVHVPLWRGPQPLRLSAALAGNFISESMILWAVLGAVYGVEWLRRLRARELQLARMSGELTAARLDALTAQLRPHFLFNALHGISVLMRRDADAAETMLANLGELLRHALDREAGQELPLQGELELLQSYLGIVRARFSDRLTIRTEVSGDAAHGLVPRLILQPLVENAIEHGIARRRGAGSVLIRGEVRDARLEIVVADDGAGLQPSTRDGIGLSNTRRRLRELYGEDQSLTLQGGAGSGLRVVLVLPYRRGAAAAAGPPPDGASRPVEG